MNRIVLLILLSFFSSCLRVGPEYCEPELQVSDSWYSDAENDQVSINSEKICEWWGSFNDPTLTELIEIAYCQNYSLKAMGTKIIQAKAFLAIAAGNQFPQVQNISGSKTKIKIARGSLESSFLPDDVGNRIDNTFSLYSLGLNLDYEFDIWGKYRRAVEVSEAEFCASVVNYDDFLVQLIANVADSYLTYQYLLENRSLVLENVAIQRRSFEIVSTLDKHGIVTNLDLQQAKSLLSSTEAKIPEIERQIEATLNSLSVLLGILPEDVRILLAKAKTFPEIPEEVFVEVPACLIRRRPDIRAAEFLAMAQCGRIGIAQADLYPHFNIAGSFGFSASSFSDLLKSSSKTYQWGPGFRWDFLNYGRLKSFVAAEDALFQELLFKYQETVLTAQSEVETAISNYRQNAERFPKVKEAADAAERAAELAMVQYRQGIIDYTPVLISQQDVLVRDEELLNNKLQKAKSVVAIYQSLGGGWELRMGNGFVDEETMEEMECRAKYGGLLSDDSCCDPYHCEMTTE